MGADGYILDTSQPVTIKLYCYICDKEWQPGSHNECTYGHYDWRYREGQLPVRIELTNYEAR